MLRESNYQVGALNIAALEFGEQKTADLSVVFLHGWLDNAASFQPLMNVLSHQSATLHGCAIDFPGHGLSSHKRPFSYYPFHDYIDDVFQFLTVLSPNRLILVGHSLGALVASCYSAAFPEQVAGLVQIEGVGPLAESPSHTVARLRKGVMSRQRIRRKPQRHFSSLEEMVARRAQTNGLTAAEISPIVERAVMQRENGWCWRHDVALQSDSLYRMSEQQAMQINQAIECPMLTILGDKGFEYLHASASQPLATDCQLVTIAGGHHCHLQQPEEVCELIFGWVNKI